MKKFLLLSMLAGSILFVLYSCQKETMDKPQAAEENSQENKGKSLTPWVPQSYFSNEQIDAPGCYFNGHGCTTKPPMPTMKRARLRWNVDYPNSAGINYVLYKKTGSSGGYNQYSKVDAFSCNKTSGMWYAGNALAVNNTTFIITLSVVGSTNPISNAPSAIKEDGNGKLYTTSGTYLPYTYAYTDTWKFTTGTATGSCNVTGPLAPFEP